MGCFVSCRISTDKRVARSLCHSRATCSRWRQPHLGLSNSLNFIGWQCLHSQTPHCTRFCQNRPFCRGDIAIFRIFKMATATILDLEIAIFYWLLWWRVSRCISMPNFVNIGQSVAKILRFFDFSRWRPSAILDLLGAYLYHSQWVLGGLYHSAKFGYDDAVVFMIWTFQYLTRLAGKCLFMPPKLGFCGSLIP